MMSNTVLKSILLSLSVVFILKDTIDFGTTLLCFAGAKSEELSRQTQIIDRFSDVPIYDYDTVMGGNHRRLTDLPLGLKHQSKDEANYLKLHKCRDAGEAYAASYLITREHLIEQFTGTN